MRICLNSIEPNSTSHVNRADFPYCRCQRSSANDPYQLVLLEKDVPVVGNGGVLTPFPGQLRRSCYSLTARNVCGGQGLGPTAAFCCRQLLRTLHKIEIEAGTCKG